MLKSLAERSINALKLQNKSNGIGLPKVALMDKQGKDKWLYTVVN